MAYPNLEIERHDGVGWLWLNRPDKLNALSADMWTDIPLALNELTSDEAVRAIVVAGRGPSFTVGIDLGMLSSLKSEDESPARARLDLFQEIKRLQTTMSVFAEAPQPVIAAIHGYCFGAGIDLITAVDIRLATADATFSVRETKMALVADVGTMQRLPSLIAPGHVAELVYTGKEIDADRALAVGLINQVYSDQTGLYAAAQSLGEEIAANSPLAVQGAKSVLRAEASMSMEQALDHVALWNAAFLHSRDLDEAVTAWIEKRPPEFRGS